MKVALLLIFVVLNYLPVYFNGIDMHLFALFLEDLQILDITLFAYLVVPFRTFPLKVLTMLVLSMMVATTLHNLAVYIGLLSETAAFYSIALQTVLYSVFGLKMFVTYEHLPNYPIVDGYIYKIVSKPKTNIQMLLFAVLNGLGGAFAITDGQSCIYMDKAAGKALKEPLDKEYLIGKKVLKIAPATPDNLVIYNSKINKKFHFWYNCYMLGRGFKK